MKIKNLNQKLTLKKSTVANLEQKELSEVKGGAYTYTCGGISCFNCPDSDVPTECVLVTVPPSCISC